MRTCLITVLLLFISLLLATEELIWQEDGLPVYINHNIKYDGACVQGEDGGFLVLWTEYLADGNGIRCMRFDASGNEIWDLYRTIASDEAPFYALRMIRSCDGNLFVFWYCCEEDGDFRGMVTKLDWDATPLWEQPVNATGSVESKMPVFKLVTDNNGGVYVLWMSNYNTYYYTLSVNHVDSNGMLDWETGAISLFEDYHYLEDEINVCPDGEGGIVVSGIIDNGFDYYGALSIQRVTPEGDTPMGENGFTELGEDTYRWNYFSEILLTREDEFALFSTWSDSSGVGYRLDRLDIDGEILSETNCEWTRTITTSCLFTTAMDSEDNLIVGWVDNISNRPRFYLDKISPENEHLWIQDGEIENIGDYGNVETMQLAVDADDNLYQVWTLANDDQSLRLQRYNSGGNPCWDIDGLIVVDEVSSIGEISILVGGQSGFLVWLDDRTNFPSIYRQSFDEYGNLVWDGDAVVSRGWDSTGSTSVFSDRKKHGQECIYFAWYNSYDNSVYLQNVDITGVYGEMEPGRKILGDETCGYTIHAVEYIDGDAFVVWTQYDDQITSTCVNRFDRQGNRRWHQDLVVLEYETNDETDYSNLKVGRYLDDLMIGWEEQASYFERVKLQRVSDGQLAWDEPVAIGEDTVHSLSLMAIIDNYVVWKDNLYRVLRITDDGLPYEGWEQEGLRIMNIDANHNNWHYFNTEEGLLIVWEMENEITNTIRVQLFHQDGSIEWNNSHAIVVDNYLYNMHAAINGKDLFVSWQSGEINFEAFNLEGNALWDSTKVLDQDGSINDMEIVAGGVLFTYYYSEGNYYNYDVGMQYLSPDGTFWSEPLIVCDAPSRQIYPELVKAVGDTYFVTWMDNRDGTSAYKPYLQLYQFEPVSIDAPTDIPAWSPNLSTYPNPFNPETTVQFSLQKDTKVALKVYNVKGQLVRTLCDEVLPLGEHQIEWDGRDNVDKNVSSGVYLINLNVNGRDYRSKALLLK